MGQSSSTVSFIPNNCILTVVTPAVTRPSCTFGINLQGPTVPQLTFTFGSTANPLPQSTQPVTTTLRIYNGTIQVQGDYSPYCTAPSFTPASLQYYNLCLVNIQGYPDNQVITITPNNNVISSSSSSSTSSSSNNVNSSTSSSTSSASGSITTSSNKQTYIIYVLIIVVMLALAGGTGVYIYRKRKAALE